MLVKFECHFQLKIIRGLYHLRLRGILLFDTVSSIHPTVTFSLLPSFFGAFVPAHCRILLRTVCSVLPWRVLQNFEHGPVLSSTACCFFFRFLSGLCGWWWFIFSMVLVLPVKPKTDGRSLCTLSCVLIVYILLKHDSKPTETAPRQEMLLISLRRRKSFWLIDLFSLEISWKGWDERGADLFFWQAEEA